MSGQQDAEVYDERSDFHWTRLDAFPCDFHIHLATLIDDLPPASRVLDVGDGRCIRRVGHRQVQRPIAGRIDGQGDRHDPQAPAAIPR